MKCISKTRLTLIITLIFFNCSCDTTAPIEKEEIKSPRDYSWSVDTVYKATSFQTLMRSIWGSDESNVYMCGHSSGPGGDAWHYDGDKWEELDFNKLVGFGAFLTSVDGSTANNVWLVGYNPLSWDNTNQPYAVNYNGTKWNMYQLKGIDSKIFDVLVESEDRVWVCGSNGIVANYNGIKWEVDTIDAVTPKENEEYNLTNIKIINGKPYTIGFTIPDGIVYQIIYYFCTKEDNQWVVKEQYKYTVEEARFGYNLDVVNGKLFSIGEQGLYKYENNTWSVKIKTEKEVTRMSYKNANDILLTSGFGVAYHYNGEDLIEIKELNKPNIIYRDLWRNDKLTIVIGELTENNQDKTIVLYGK